MNHYELPDGERLERVRRETVEAMVTDDLLSAAETTSGRPVISASRLYLRAIGQVRADDRDLDRTVGADPRLRSLYGQILRSCARFPALELMAASTGVATGRRGTGYRILPLQPSRAHPSQHYLVIEFETEPDRPPERMIFIDADERCYEFRLPSMRERVMQLVVEQDSELWRLLHQPRADILLQ